MSNHVQKILTWKGIEPDPWSASIRKGIPKAIRPLHLRGWESLAAGLVILVFSMVVGYFLVI